MKGRVFTSIYIYIYIYIIIIFYYDFSDLNIKNYFINNIFFNLIYIQRSSYSRHLEKPQLYITPYLGYKI